LTKLPFAAYALYGLGFLKVDDEKIKLYLELHNLAIVFIFYLLYQ